jgi:hypothetical protein
VADSDQTQPGETSGSDLTDELAKKYDPERLLRIISKRAGKGESLDHTLRSRYEKRFGVDLSHVRIYTGEFAEEFNKQRNAYAVTVGGTGMILMGNSPDKSMASASGQALLGHELTHVAQQARGLHRKSTGGAMPFAEEHEAEAEAVEADILAEEQGSASSDTRTAANAGSDRIAAEEQRRDMIEKLKARAMAMVGETLRNQMMRNGVLRRA